MIPTVTGTAKVGIIGDRLVHPSDPRVVHLDQPIRRHSSPSVPAYVTHAEGEVAAISGVHFFAFFKDISTFKSHSMSSTLSAVNSSVQGGLCTLMFSAS